MLVQKMMVGFKHGSNYLFAVPVRLAHRANTPKSPSVFPALNTDTPQPFAVGPEFVRCRSGFPGERPVPKPPPVTWLPAGQVISESKPSPG